jgi:uncharacterized protein YndB with AHSA1/START domain
MAEIHVFAERAIDAPPERVYRCIADYHQHAQFLPSAFSDVNVEEGGVGSGTVVSFNLTAGGRQRSYRMHVTEPEPGRVLTESDENSTAVTSFTVSPSGVGSRVRIDTRWQGAGGIGGFMEHTFAPRVLRRLYEEELNMLDRYAREGAGRAV